MSAASLAYEGERRSYHMGTGGSCHTPCAVHGKWTSTNQHSSAPKDFLSPVIRHGVSHNRLEEGQEWQIVQARISSSFSDSYEHDITKMSKIVLPSDRNQKSAVSGTSKNAGTNILLEMCYLRWWVFRIEIESIGCSGVDYV